MGNPFENVLILCLFHCAMIQPLVFSRLYNGATFQEEKKATP